jgi:cation transport ATPase
VAAIEERSRHPVAAAFRDWGGRARVEITAVATIPGIGIQAALMSEGRKMALTVGNRGVLEGVANGDPSALLAGLRRPAGHLHEIFVVVDGRLMAAALVRERMRDSVARARQALAGMGMAVKVMTGDRADSASVLELADCEAGLTAEEKARRVAASQDAGARVLFVGDGVNDAPAMATAFASVAMSGGAALPREVADAALYGGDLGAVAGAVRIGRRVVGGIRANLLFAAVYNFLGIGLAAAGVLHPVAAAVLMLISSVTVSWRALRFGEALKETPADDRAVDPVTAAVP